AREALCGDGAERPAPHRLLPHPPQPGGRAGDAGETVGGRGPPVVGSALVPVETATRTHPLEGQNEAERNHSEHPRGRRLTLLCLGGLGVVYGDIGTSPLYSMRECFHGEHAVPPTHANVLGVLSLIFWALVIIVTLKYHVYVLRADNRGEGGILALMALVRR